MNKHIKNNKYVGNEKVKDYVIDENEIFEEVIRLRTRMQYFWVSKARFSGIPGQTSRLPSPDLMASKTKFPSSRDQIYRFPKPDFQASVARVPSFPVLQVSKSRFPSSRNQISRLLKPSL